MPIEVISLSRPSVFKEDSLARKAEALACGRLDIPESVSTVLEDGEHQVVFEGLETELRVEILVLNRTSALAATTQSDGVRRVVRMPQETDAMIIAEESEGGNLKVHGFILSRK
ncbi:MAG: hypothetical protein A2186_00520 [Candidatus Levybacteria bacterium RIFOXYA1_FULL_41_10]|nr:MAG: hypothetical protein UT44_C0037G0001 [Candidatus Levybacteria bacterium GW2011_GWA1_39_32]KKR50932.1 MAG: hypothetical protein UT87_C0010G0034 [Candidatus Levybacteria bacterium GW2011_GWC1_40_19]KKR92335.1 MAG: hypothetical protein UU44_C0007G0001 [Candidatus Daviesbacteria bacterium GW2011_GWB1_41_15]KKR94203.1 MAG: hypothetical protein UU45_C0014G0007 [Candidatus Levybacteria bacterium GW2011_GWA2_41_15]OGH25627.1 MAG: hypothetical protein A3D82_02105 [Candidatus Levybacteria bacteri